MSSFRVHDLEVKHLKVENWNVDTTSMSHAAVSGVVQSSITTVTGQLNANVLSVTSNTTFNQGLRVIGDLTVATNTTITSVTSLSGSYVGSFGPPRVGTTAIANGGTISAWVSNASVTANSIIIGTALTDNVSFTHVFAVNGSFTFVSDGVSNGNASISYWIARY